VPVPHEPHWDEHGDCTGFIGPEEERFAEECEQAREDSWVATPAERLTNS
jgi:hypothetical protein